MSIERAAVDGVELPARPGKIVAVHLSYISRAKQRGRRPTHPSYFFKPSSSVSTAGGVIERPSGTELLAFEGEIALIIGKAARRVPIDKAWSHISGVTAANDFGLYDLRDNDKGSNVRSKGRDGYTPMGPGVIDAKDVDPNALRLRTWVNAQLVQNDTTDALLFSLAQLVADLSQHFTLEPGDVILTGTPAGSSVVVPGDVVEVEVDAPSTTLTSGRLTTRIVQGDSKFDPKIGSVPAVNDTQRAEAWGSMEVANLNTPTTAFTLTEELGGKLAAVPVAGLSQELRKRGLNNVSIDGVAALAPGTKMVGVARTLRFVPNREDLFDAHGGGYNVQKRTFDTVEPGEVIVIEARGEQGSGTLGDILALRARERGAAGVVTDGGVRDRDTVVEIGLPVFAAGPHPAVLGRRHVPWESDITIACGGTTVQPGDVIVGDSDGVIVIPPAIAEEVANAALAQEQQDQWIADQVAAGSPVEGLFPPNDEWRTRYEKWRLSQHNRR
ncbi:fumarylacetoacetate hydrolase family protein [Rhodococcus sp. NPDC060176]|uniref:fumarylacetoacetate hydrolase family protein n=1 Tax=Rhodococcus sp. NPDC060176 TaxID=3347062 RepID=UPI003655A88E